MSLKRFKSIGLKALLLGLIAQFSPIAAQAIELPDLYQASVTVVDQTRDARVKAQREVFAKVLVKVSGNSDVLKNPAVKTAVRRASQYLNQFEFSRDSDNVPQIEASFDEGKVNRLLRQQSLPIWGKRRPSILLWMAGEDQQSGARGVISRESNPQLLSQIEQLSKDRGLPIIFPLYDLEDNKEVSASDVWGYFFAHINQYSLRYNSDAMVISRFWHQPPTEDTEATPDVAPAVNDSADTIKDNNWHLQWRLYEKEELVEIKTISGELTKLMDTLVQTTADRYAAAYAVDSKNLGADATRIVLTVRNVGQIADLIHAEQLLTSFSAVSDVLLKSINNDVAEFEIVLLGELLDLMQGLDLEERFQRIYDPLADKNSDQLDQFRWTP
ncbi:MAG: hypothetical protein ACI8WB_005224 [Phenylobacterium sp.]